MVDKQKSKKAARIAKKKVSETFKRNRTVSLTEPNFSRFQALCKKGGITVSEQVDALISAYLSL